MFPSLNRVFQGDRKPAEQRVLSRKKIVAILQQLKACHELLSVAVPGFPQSANSAILGIREANERFYLDELSLCGAHEAFLQKRKARIACRLQGMELHFAVRLLRATSDGGIAVYEIAIPKSVLRVQRRESFRLRLSPGLTVPVTVPYLEGERVSGEAFDLSACGIGAFLKTRNIPSRGQVLTNLTINLPKAGSFKSNVEVRFARLDSAHNMLRIGARFVKLDNRQERFLAQFLAEQQRKRRRFGPR
jgi:c-di-GMP-binding flagellar brake protein YcgR